MNRRTFLKAIVGALAAVPFVKAAKKPEPIEYTTVAPTLACPTEPYDLSDGYAVQVTYYVPVGTALIVDKTMYMHPYDWKRIDEAVAETRC